MEKIKEIEKEKWEEALNNIFVLALKRSDIAFNSVPKILREDFDNFIYGQTIRKNKKGQLCAYIQDFRRWVRKVQYEGLDYSIKLIDKDENKEKD